MDDSAEDLKALSGHCSAINNGVLYAFTDTKLLSIPLKKNATISQEAKPKQSATGPACVKVTRGGDGADAAMYVIGGGDTPSGYSGLQRYFFGNSTWETLSPPVNVLATRTNHSVTYLPESEEIMVYAGSTENAPSLLSSQTFIVSTHPPFNIRSFTSQAPPATRPILQPWNTTHAVMVGGQFTSTGIWLFGPDQGWSQLDTDLAAPLEAGAQGILIDSSDGSKVLQVYDTTQAPNTVQNIVLLEPFGLPAATGTTVGGRSSSSSSSRKRKRDLTLIDWPEYNSTNAPTSTRTDYSLAQRADGLVVMAGGNEKVPIIMYDRERNSWVDTDDIFGQKPLIPTSTSTSSATATPTRTSTPSATTSAASKDGAGGGSSSHDRTMRTLGITLGVLCGIAALFILILLYLRWRKLKAKRKGGYLEEKNRGDADRMSFADRGASFMKEAGMSRDDLARYDRDTWQPPPNQHAHSSLAIMTGKYGKFNANNNAPKGSFESTAQLVKNKNGTFIPTDNVEMMDIGDKSSSSLAVPGAAVLKGNGLDKDAKAERKRSSGWSKYFATTAPSGPNGLSHIPSAYVKPGTSPIPESEYSGDGDRGAGSRLPSSALVAPLDIDFQKTVDGQRLSHVASRSPAFFDSKDDFISRGSNDIAEGQRGLIVDPNDPRRSHATSVSSYDNRSTMDSTATSEFYNESGHTPWTPMSGNPPVSANSASTGQVAGRERRTSSVYTASAYDPDSRRPSRGKSAGFFPGTGVGYAKPPKIKLSHAASPTADWAAPPNAPFAAKSAGEIRDSTSSVVTVFPGVPSGYYEDKAKENSQLSGARDAPPKNTDMSWLNLGLNKSPSPS